MAHLGKVMVPKGAQEFESLTLLQIKEMWCVGNSTGGFESPLFPPSFGSQVIGW